MYKEKNLTAAVYLMLPSINNRPYHQKTFEYQFVLVLKKTSNNNTVLFKYFVLIGQFWGTRTKNCTLSFMTVSTYFKIYRQFFFLPTVSRFFFLISSFCFQIKEQFCFSEGHRFCLLLLTTVTINMFKTTFIVVCLL